MKAKLKLGRELFWDINEKDIDKALSDSKEWVVVRVFDYGTVDEIFQIIEFYGKQTVKNILLKARLRPVAKAMGKLFLDLSLKKIICS